MGGGVEWDRTLTVANKVRRKSGESKHHSTYVFLHSQSCGVTTDCLAKFVKKKCFYHLQTTEQIDNPWAVYCII
jgi:hypothetical protein